MKGKCFNYRFFMLLLFPFVGTTLSIILLILLRELVFYVAFGVGLISIVFFIELVFLEPVYYIINKNGIKVFCGFKQYYFPWDQIDHIELHYDVFLEFLFIKDYVLVSKTPSKTVKRYERILEYTKTNKLIELYGGSKIRR